MGGTSSDVAVVSGDELPVVHEKRVLDLAVRTPAIDILAIGAGGGSIGWLDGAGELRVGPRSAGADPGPACYGRGGAEPTITDANVVLGVLGTDQLLGGEVQLDAGAAHRACERLAKRLGLDVLETAWGIRRIAEAAMAGAVRTVSVGRGHDPRDFALVAFGAAGPLHAAAIADEVDVPLVVVPPVPGCHSALGQVLTDVIHDHVAAQVELVRAGLEEALGERYAALERSGRDGLRDEGVRVRDQTLAATLDMRYAGQQSSVGVPVGARRRGWLARATADFHRLHEQLFGFSVPGEPVEVVTLRLRAVGRLAPEAAAPAQRVRRRAEPRAAGTREVAFGPRERERERARIFRRDTLAPGVELRGPAVVEQDDATTLVPPGATARCDGLGNLLISR
jgi:N-methylhydantoinase A